MAAIIGLDDALIAEACAAASHSQVVAAVNFNSPGQVVIAGHAAAVERAIEGCKQRGAKRALALPVSAPFHTSLMRPAGERLAEDLQQLHIAVPVIAVIHNVHAGPERDPARIRELLVRQIHSPVQWAASVRYLVAQGVTKVLELGPGKVLGGLCKRVDASLDCLASEDPQDMDKALAAMSA